jgi:hypothetical protein
MNVFTINHKILAQKNLNFWVTASATDQAVNFKKILNEKKISFVTSIYVLCHLDV